MGKIEHIPAPAIKRLSLYLRQLELLQAGDRKTVSSRQLGESLGLSDAQVRKDLAYFGQFGHPGVGYRVGELVQRLRRILGTDKKTNVLLVGAGNLGRALIAYRGFAKRGFEVVAVFDNDEEKIGRPVAGRNGLKVRPLSELPAAAKGHNIRVAMLAVPAPSAQGVADLMVTAGIRGILNFAPVTLQVPPGVGVSSVDLAVHLEQLSYKISAMLG